jgi:DNA-binding NarL/FixJ family response regulator
MDRTIRLIVADSSPHARHGLCAILAAQPSVEIVGEASQAAEVLALVEAQHPDVALLDVCMPAMDGIRATRVIKKRWPRVRVILISMYADSQNEALESGADAFLVKGCPADELIAAVMGQETGVAAPSTPRKKR